MSTSRKVRVECFVNQLGFYSFYKLFFVFGEYSDVNSIQLIVLRRNISKYNKITKLSAHWVTWSIMNLRPIKRLLQEQNDVLWTYKVVKLGFPHSSIGKNSSCNAGDLGLIPGSGRSSGEGNGNPLQYSCLENPMDKGAWQATVHGIARVCHDLVIKPPWQNYHPKNLPLPFSIECCSISLEHCMNLLNQC